MKNQNAMFKTLAVNAIYTLLLMVIINVGYSQTTIGGVLYTSTLTEASSPYHVTSNVFIPEGEVVTVEPGVVLEFDSNISMLIHGAFRAIGNETDSIFFKPHASAGSGWGAIKWETEADDYNESTGTGNILSYVSYYGTSSIPPYLWIKDCKVRIQHSRFHDCPKQFTCLGNAQIYNNLFHNMDAVAIAGGRSSDLEPAQIYWNEFYNIHDDYSAIYINGGQFIENYVHDINTPDRILQVGTGSLIAKNRIENCNGIGIYTSDYHEESEIYCNTVKNNLVNLYIQCKANVIISNNNFLNPIDYNVVLRGTDGPDPYIGYQVSDCDGIPAPGSYDLIDLKGNFWGDLSDTELIESFYDFDDDFNIGLKVDASEPAESMSCRTGAVTLSEENEVDFNLYPNPTFHYINIDSESTLQSVTILDQLGRVMFQSLDQSKSINVSEFPVGVYYVQVISNAGGGSKVFIKQ